MLNCIISESIPTKFSIKSKLAHLEPSSSQHALLRTFSGINENSSEWATILALSRKKIKNNPPPNRMKFAVPSPHLHIKDLEQENWIPCKIRWRKNPITIFKEDFIKFSDDLEKRKGVRFRLRLLILILLR